MLLFYKISFFNNEYQPTHRLINYISYRQSAMEHRHHLQLNENLTITSPFIRPAVLNQQGRWGCIYSQWRGEALYNRGEGEGGGLLGPNFTSASRDSGRGRGSEWVRWKAGYVVCGGCMGGVCDGGVTVGCVDTRWGAVASSVQYSDEEARRRREPSTGLHGGSVSESVVQLGSAVQSVTHRLIGSAIL